MSILPSRAPIKMFKQLLASEFRPHGELAESHRRKSVFLREACRELQNVRVIPKRAEEIDESFDWLISRAVSPADILRLKLANNLALLIGKEDASNLHGTNEAIPWGKHR